MATVLCVHGLGGTPATFAHLAEVLGAAGHEVVAPTLPGHGSAPEDLVGLAWRDWFDGAVAALPDGRVDVAIGQSMGADLVLDLAAAGRAARAVAINPLAPDADAVDGLEWRRERGHEWVDADAAAVEDGAYSRLPVGALLAMAEGVVALDLAAVACPVLVVTSVDDEVVDPASSDVVAASLGGPVARLHLPRSGHVATLDVERDVLADAVLAFIASDG